MNDMNLNDTDLNIDIAEAEDDSDEITRTYKIDWENGRIGGMTDELEAVQQAIIKILLTERYRNLIYSWEYGSEIKSTLQSEDCTNEFLEVEIPALITEALLQDKRILEVDNFNLTFWKDSVSIECDVVTIYGNTTVKAVV